MGGGPTGREVKGGLEEVKGGPEEEVLRRSKESTTTQRGRTKNTRRIRLCNVVVRRDTTTQRSRRVMEIEQGTEKLTKA